MMKLFLTRLLLFSVLVRTLAKNIHELDQPKILAFDRNFSHDTAINSHAICDCASTER